MTLLRHQRQPLSPWVTNIASSTGGGASRVGWGGLGSCHGPLCTFGSALGAASAGAGVAFEALDVGIPMASPSPSMAPKGAVIAPWDILDALESQIAPFNCWRHMPM